VPVDSLNNVGHLTKEIVHFASNISYSDVPPDVIEHTKLVLLDTLGVLLAAADPKYSAGNILAKFIRNLGGIEESTVIGRDFKSSCVNAALFNGTLGYYSDMDAYHGPTLMHAPATIVPTCLAVGEREKANGKDFLLSLILGIDVGCRISLALNPRPLTERGFHPTSVAGSFAAAVAAGRLLNLDPERFSIALGLAGNQTSGLRAWKEDFSENSRPFNSGIAARNGVTACLLAKLGFGGPPDIFEGIYNIFRAYSKDGEYDIDQLTQDLGVRFLIMEHAFKLYSCCAYLHPGLDALLSIIKEHNLRIEDIENILMRFPESGVEMIDGTQLRSHSVQYTFAVAARKRKVMIDDILHNLAADPEVNRLIGNTEILGDEILDANFPDQFLSIVEITTMQGEQFSERVDFAKGTPENPADRHELEEKFFDLSGQVIKESAGKEIVYFIDDIENLDDINSLCKLLKTRDG